MRILWVGLLLGLVFKLFGWSGNVFVLGPVWREAVAFVADVPWRNSSWHYLLKDHVTEPRR